MIILIEAIFLAEHFTWVFRDAVRHEADLSGIALVLACTSTEIFDLALAVAILMASLSSPCCGCGRTARLLVLFASGLGPYQLGVLVLIVALAGQVISIIGSGVVDPLSRYAQRSILFSSGTALAEERRGQERILLFPLLCRLWTMERVGKAAPPPPASAGGGADQSTPAERQARARQGPHPVRLPADRAAHLARRDRRPGAAGWSRSQRQDRAQPQRFHLAHFRRCPSAWRCERDAPGATCSNAPIAPTTLTDAPPVTMKVRDMSQLMMVDQLLPFTARSSNMAEQTHFRAALRAGLSPTRMPAPTRCACWPNAFPAAFCRFWRRWWRLLGVALTNRTDQLVRAAAGLPGA